MLVRTAQVREQATWSRGTATRGASDVTDISIKEVEESYLSCVSDTFVSAFSKEVVVKNRFRGVKVFAIPLICAALLSVSFWSNEASATSAARTKPTSSLLSPATTAYLKAQIASISSLPKFVAPGPAFNAGKVMKGKSILSIPTSSANPFTEGIELNMQAIAKQIGFKFQSWTNQGQPSQWVEGVDYAITGKFNLIDMLAGTNPADLLPQIAAARKAGIKVVSTHITGMGKWDHQPGVNANMPIDYEGVGRLLADWVMLQTAGRANVLVLESLEATSTAPEVEGITSEFAKYDPSSTVKVQNAPIPEWSTKIQPEVEAQVASDPGLNYVIPIYDSMSQFVVAGLKVTHEVGKIKIATFNGTPFVIGLIDSGAVQMDIGENLNWIAHAVLDDEMRLLGGLPFLTNEHIPLYVFTRANAASAGIPPTYSKGYGGNSYILDYNRLWELAS